MPAGIWKLDNTEVTPYANTTPRYESIQVWHRTLDGKPLVQTIGDPVQVVDVELWTYKAGKVMLDLCQATGEPIVVSDGFESWTGLIKDQLSWEKPSRSEGLFRTTLTIEVLPED